MERSNTAVKVILGGVTGAVVTMAVNHVIPLPENWNPLLVAGSSGGALAAYLAIEEKKKDPTKKNSEVLREHLEQAPPGSEQAAILAKTFIQALALEKTGEPTPPQPTIEVPDYVQQIDEKGYATTPILPQSYEAPQLHSHPAGDEHGAALDQRSIQQPEPERVEYPVAVPVDRIPDGFGGGVYPFIPTPH